MLGKPRYKKQLLTLLERMASNFTDDELQEATELVTMHDQPNAALNLISTWLYENQVEITREDYEQFQSVCQKFDMPDSAWEMLGVIVRD